jgi:hypothetical protein
MKTLKNQAGPEAKMPELLQGVYRYQDALPKDLFGAVSAVAQSDLPWVSAKTTYWQRADAPGDTVIEAAIRRLALMIPDPGPIIGIDWWLRVKPVTDFFPFHFDKDETRTMIGGEILHPTYIGVLYLTDVGGLTVIVDQTINAVSRELEPADFSRGLESPAQSNAFLAFPGHLRHCILPPELVAQSTSTRNAQRGSLILNFWTQRPLAPACQDPRAEQMIPYQDLGGPHSSQSSDCAESSAETLMVIREHQRAYEDFRNRSRAI